MKKAADQDQIRRRSGGDQAETRTRLSAQHSNTTTLIGAATIHNVKEQAEALFCNRLSSIDNQQIACLLPATIYDLEDPFSKRNLYTAARFAMSIFGLGKPLYRLVLAYGKASGWIHIEAKKLPEPPNCITTSILTRQVVKSVIQA